MEGYLGKEISSRRLLLLLLVLLLLLLLLLCCGLGFEVGDGAVGDPLCRVVLFIVDVRAAIPEREMREMGKRERRSKEEKEREGETRDGEKRDDGETREKE